MQTSLGRDMFVRDLMTRNPQTAAPDEHLSDVLERMRNGRFRRLPVVEDGRLTAIVTDGDIREHVGHLARSKVTAAMTPDPETVMPTATLEEAARKMLQLKVDGLPVVEGEKLVGIVTTTDLLRAFVRFDA